MKKLSPELVLKELYYFICAVCTKELHFAPSIWMTDFRQNEGHATCPQCKTFLHLEIDGLNEEGRSEPWDDFMKRERTEGHWNKLWRIMMDNEYKWPTIIEYVYKIQVFNRDTRQHLENSFTDAHQALVFLSQSKDKGFDLVEYLEVLKCVD